jgi:gamma-glutamyltranspeptidase/glutathione hydrolase
VEPWNSGLGGGGQLIFAEASGPVRAIDFLPLAPAKLDVARYPIVGAPSGSDFGWPAVTEHRNVLGPEAICLPGAVDGLGLAVERFGRKTLAEVLGPAIDLAERGLPVDWQASRLITASARDLERFEASRRMFLPNGSAPLPPEHGGPAFLPLVELATTYRQLAAAGRRDFYEGETAQMIAADLLAGGSAITAADLQAYRANIVEPIACGYRANQCHAIGGMSGGPMVIEALRRLEVGSELSAAPPASVYFHCAEILLALFEERLATFGHAARPGHTTNVAAVDRDGNMVAVTNTVGVSFGSKVVLPRTGILMNSAINNFDPVPGRPNSIAPGQAPVLNIAPVILSFEGRPWAALGASGGRRIIPAVVQLASFLIDRAMPIERAFATPRVDVGPGRIVCDARLSDDVRQSLLRLAPVEVAEQRVTTEPFGVPTGVTRDLAKGLHAGMAHVFSPTAGAVSEASRTG